MTRSELNKFKNRVSTIGYRVLPNNLDRTEDGEFVISESGNRPNIGITPEGNALVDGKEIEIKRDKNGYPLFNTQETKKAFAYFLNEDCILTFSIQKGKIKPYYYSDADVKYYFKVDVNPAMSDEEIKYALIKGFSDKFGWIDIFNENEEVPADVDKKFFVEFVLDEETKIVETDRDFFNLHVKTLEFDWGAHWQQMEEEDDFDLEDAYDVFANAALELAKKHFDPEIIDGCYPECLQLTQKDRENGIFACINLAN